ncbi:MAG: Ku protein [Firmicutes bacterium]|nr:Ku protein [Bacillota bacterium]
MRPMWKGAVSFGLVNIPVKMYAAVEDRSLKFKYLHKKCNTPLKYKRTCPRCDQEVEWEEIVRGYEFQKDRFVLVEDEDFEKIPSKQTRAIDIIDFCELKEIDPIYYERSYYLGPEETGKKAYNLLVSALRDTGKVAVAKVVIRSKQALAAVRVFDDVLVMETMNYPDEVRSRADVPGVEPSLEVSDRELEMATQLVSSMAAPFEPEKYTDEYRRALLELIEAKIAGKEPVQPDAAPTEGVVDLMDALRSSLEAVEKERFTPDKQKPREKGKVV